MRSSEGRALVVVRFEELAFAPTELGELVLRRRREPTLDVEVYEIKLGEEYLMSSLFTAAEIELARLGLERVLGPELDVVVGGLGLGYTAATALADPRVRSLIVVETLGEVIGWHQQGLLPEATGLTTDARARLVHRDFFAQAAGPEGFDPATPGRRFHVVLLDIDHTPRHVLHPSHAAFYTTDGLQRLADQLLPEGVFALWSDDPPDADFLAVLAGVLEDPRAQVISFPNPLTGGTSSNTIYLGTRAP